jgi:ATP-dependent DNA helicase RecG
MIYLPKAVSAETLANDNRDIKLQLASLRFYDLVYDCPTNAGVFMFGNNVRYFFPMAYVQFVKFEENQIIADTMISGDLISIVNELNSFVKINIIKRRPIPISTLIEEDVYNYSESAIREFLMNALMHRSYEITSYIKFYQYSDRIEIENPGGLYGNARPENFPNVSDYRNLVIAEAMRVMGFVNRFNWGIKNAQLNLERNKNVPAEFDLDTFGVFRVIVKEKPIEKIKASFSNPWDGTIKDTDNEIDKKSGTLNGTLNDTLKNDLAKIFDLIQKQPGISQSNIIKEIKKSRMTIYRFLDILKTDGLIEYKGSKKTGGYHLTDKAKNKLK